ncbi:SNARE-like superfamily protein [Zea mays]|uniref:Coatomer subunit zeta n=1 Tax=Zea mays TaxID=4577 RepID=A0A1D6LC73_MAIZE|nr:SNARE-like superfamily protein [Zea mays]
MILAVLFANSDGNILVERFHGVPAEERLHWRSFLVKLGSENLKGSKNEELHVASHKSVSIVYTTVGDVCLYIVGKDEYDELACESQFSDSLWSYSISNVCHLTVFLT